MKAPTAIVLAALGLFSARAAFATARDLPLQVTGCPEELANSLPAALGLEIDVLRRERGATRAAPDAVAVRCAGDAAAIEVTVGSARRTSTIGLGALAPDHRARALALAAAELVDALAAAPAEPPAPSPPAAVVVPPPPAVEGGAPVARASPPSPPRPAVLAGGAVEWLGKPAALLFGARLAYQHSPFPWLAPMLSLDGAFGDVASPPGRVTARTLGFGAHLFFEASAGRLRFEAGPGVRVGWARVAGEPPPGSMLEGRALSAWWGGPELRLRVSATMGRYRAPRVAVELGGGIVALPVHGLVDGGVTVYGVEGAWLSLSLQIGLDLGSG